MPADIKIDISEIIKAGQAYEAMVGAEGVVRAMTRAINYVGDKATTQVRRQLAAQTGMPYGTVKDATRTYEATWTNPEYAIEATGRHAGLIHFRAEQTSMGVTAEPWGRRRLFHGTFIARSLAGTPQVFRRTGRYTISTVGRYAGKQRETIEKLWGPSLPRELLRDATPEVFEGTVRDQLPHRIPYEVERLLKQGIPNTV